MYYVLYKNGVLIEIQIDLKIACLNNHSLFLILALHC